MDMKGHFSGTTVKLIRQGRQQALRAGDVRVIKRATALLARHEHTVPEVVEDLGVSAATLYRWLQAIILEGVSGLW